MYRPIDVLGAIQAVGWASPGAWWPSGLERWLGLATGRSRPGSNPTAENFASELWQFRLPRFASVFRYARGSKRSHQSALECVTVVVSA